MQLEIAYISLLLLRGQHHCSTRVGHVIDENRYTTGDITNEYHALNLKTTSSKPFERFPRLICALALFVNEREVDIESIGDRRNTLGTACVWRHNDRPLPIRYHLAYVLENCWFRQQIVDGDVEEALKGKQMAKM